MMTKGRLETFSDGVIAILITIMILELKTPEGSDFSDLRPLVPTLLAYLLSFVMLAIYWNNHHHLYAAVERIDGLVMWANMILLFWLSLLPLATSWMGEHAEDAVPVAAYGVVFIGAAASFFLLVRALLRTHHESSTFALAIGRDWKGKASLLVYLVALPLAFVATWISIVLYVGVALIWLVPDRRISRALDSGAGSVAGLVE